MKIILLAMALIAAAISFTQETSSKNEAVGSSEVVNQNPELHLLAANVNTKYAAFKQSSNGSRTTSNKAASELDEALNVYISALETELKTADNATAEALKTELTRAIAMKQESRTNSGAGR